MNTELLQSMYAAKNVRRNVLTRLSIDDRVAIIEKLRDMGVALKAARGTFKAEAEFSQIPLKPKTNI